MYHGFTDKKNQECIENYKGNHVNIELFKSQIKYITENYNVISLNKYIDFCNKGKKLPPKSIIITIDDGYKSNYTLAFPILRDLDIPATIFLTTDFIDNKKFIWVDRLEYAINNTNLTELKLKIGENELCFPLTTIQHKIFCDQYIRAKLKLMKDLYIEEVIQQIEDKLQCKIYETQNVPEIYNPLEWKEVSEIINSSKVNFGSHTHKHLILARYDNELIRKELLQSKNIIEKETGIKTRLFCYPNGALGDFNAKTKQILKESGYSCALTTVRGMNNKNSDLYELKRFAVDNTNFYSFVLTISGVKYFFSQMRDS